MVTPANNDHINTIPLAHTEKQYRITKATAIFWSTASVITMIAGIILESLGVILVGAIGLILTLILRNREVKRVVPPAPVAAPVAQAAPAPVPPVKKAEPSASVPTPKPVATPVPIPAPIPVPVPTVVEVIVPEIKKEDPEVILEPVPSPEPEPTPGFLDEKDDDIESPLPAPLYVDFDQMSKDLHRVEVQLAEGQSPGPETSSRDTVSESDRLVQPTLLSEAVIGTPSATMPVEGKTPPQVKRGWNPFAKKTV